MALKLLWATDGSEQAEEALSLMEAFLLPVAESVTVLGSRGHSAFVSLILGSDAQAVAHHSRASVLVAKKKPDSS